MATRGPSDTATWRDAAASLTLSPTTGGYLDWEFQTVSAGSWRFTFQEKNMLWNYVKFINCELWRFLWAELFSNMLFGQMCQFQFVNLRFVYVLNLASAYVEVPGYRFQISSCGKGRNWKMALHFLIPSDLICYNATLSAGEKCSTWQMVCELFGRISSVGLQADVTSFNATLSSLEKAWQWHKSLSLFHELEAVGRSPTVITCNALLSSFEKSAQWRCSIDFFDQISQRGLERSIRSYGAVVSSCEQLGMVSAGDFWHVVCLTQPNGFATKIYVTSATSGKPMAFWTSSCCSKTWRVELLLLSKSTSPRFSSGKASNGPGPFTFSPAPLPSSFSARPSAAAPSSPSGARRCTSGAVRRCKGCGRTRCAATACWAPWKKRPGGNGACRCWRCWWHQIWSVAMQWWVHVKRRESGKMPWVFLLKQM